MVGYMNESWLQSLGQVKKRQEQKNMILLAKNRVIKIQIKSEDNEGASREYESEYKGVNVYLDVNREKNTFNVCFTDLKYDPLLRFCMKEPLRVRDAQKLDKRASLFAEARGIRDPFWFGWRENAWLIPLVQAALEEDTKPSMADVSYGKTVTGRWEKPTNTNERFKALIKRCMKSEDEILISLTPRKVRLLHDAIGLAGEVGEILDTLKKHIFYNQPLNTENLIEEAGDVRFYFDDILETIGVDEDFVKERCIEKLEKRYPSGYTDKNAKARLDKKGEE